ncbi:ATP synthase F1 subunit epsilon [Caloramator proteoclasticus]|uniref:ATP synthase epsilon chain n=1 Tax=Caloramator proteoclasticus DSM 10124 TaxID=1121262 RepID=A0A1M4SBK8_9CLOT|nr:ATP synthase F1 subunit epsilon [Caloramator proteoclasticus]SHE29525.1 ATP synthase F1 subcomplex epsilon subunit [Caloramator proteoclasticus DSM 10124]
MAKFSLEIVTPDRRFFKGEVDSLIVSSLVGKMQFLANHTPYVAALLPDVIKITQNGFNKYAVIAGGFIEFIDNKAIIMADAAEWPEEIDRERAEEELDRARKKLQAKDENIDYLKAKLKLMKATARLKASDIMNKK